VRLHEPNATTHLIANAFLSVSLSVCLSNTCIVTKRKKLVRTFLHITENRLT